MLKHQVDRRLVFGLSKHRPRGASHPPKLGSALSSLLQTPSTKSAALLRHTSPLVSTISLLNLPESSTGTLARDFECLMAAVYDFLFVELLADDFFLVAMRAEITEDCLGKSNPLSSCRSLFGILYTNLEFVVIELGSTPFRRVRVFLPLLTRFS